MRTMTLAGLAAAMAAGFGAASVDADWRKVLVSKAEVHAKADPASEVIKVLDRGRFINQINSDGIWKKINDPVDGWISGKDISDYTVFKDGKLFEVKVKHARIRVEPRDTAKTRKIVKKFQNLKVVGKLGNWKLVSSPVDGWIHEKNVRYGLRRFVKEGPLNVRTSPSRSAHVKKRLKRRAEVHVTAKKGEWRHIDKPVHGWVHSNYLSTKRPKQRNGGSVHVGSTNSHGFAQLPRSARGIYWYCPITTHHWGVPRMIAKTLTMGQKTSRSIGCGDISLPYGGYFPPHSTHQDGRAEDILPMSSTYYTQQLVNLMYSTGGISFILHNNSGVRGVRYAPGHYDHLHMAIY